MVQTDKAASTSHGHFNPPRPSSSSSSSSSPLSDLYKSSSNKLGQVRCRLKEEEKQEEEGGGGRKRQEKTGIGRDVANKRGKDKESFTNMTHERRFFNGWVVRLSSFEVSMLPFFFSPFLKYCIISNIFPQVSSYLRGGVGGSYLFWLLIFRGLVSGNSSPAQVMPMCGKAESRVLPLQRVVNRKTETFLWTNFPSHDHITETPVLPWQFDVGCLWFITSARQQSSNRHEAISEQFSLSVNSFWLQACFECQVN